MNQPLPPAATPPLTPQQASKRLIELFAFLPNRTPAAVEELLRAGASPDTRDNIGCTPLHYAAGNNHIDLLQLLLRYGASVDAIHEHGATPLHFAARSPQCFDALRILLDHGADPSIKNIRGDSALAVAAGWPSSHYDNEADKLLLPHPLTDINGRNHQNETAFDIAIRNKATRLAARLADAGAFIDPRHAQAFGISNRYKEAQQIWSDFNTTPTAKLDHKKLMRLSNIGKLGELFSHSHWHSRTNEMRTLFDSLHPSLQQDALMQSPALVHYFNARPNTSITGWNIDQSPAKGPQR